jgi:hypothetical protein
MSIDVRGSELHAEHLGLVKPEARQRAIDLLCARGAALQAQDECLTLALYEAHRALAQPIGARQKRRTVRVVAGAMRAVGRWRRLARTCALRTRA